MTYSFIPLRYERITFLPQENQPQSPLNAVVDTLAHEIPQHPQQDDETEPVLSDTDVSEVVSKPASMDRELVDDEISSIDEESIKSPSPYQNAEQPALPGTSQQQDASLDLIVDNTPYQQDTERPLSWFKRLRPDFRVAVVLMLIVWGWALIYGCFGYQPKYVSHSMVLIKDSAITGRYVLPDQYYALQTTSSSAANPVLNTMGLLKSESISKSLWLYFKNNHPEELKRLKIKTYAQWETMYGTGKSYIKSKNEPGTDLISVYFTWNDPKMSQEGLNVILKTFSDASLKLNKAEQRNRSKYLEYRVKEINTQLENLRREKREYKDQVGSINSDPKNEELIKAQIEISNRLSSTLAAADGKEAEYKRFQTMLGMTPENALTASAIGLNPTLSKLQDDYYKLSQNYAFVKASLTDKNPKVRELHAQLEEIEKNLRSETGRTLGKESIASQPSAAVSDTTRAKVVNQMVSAQAETMRLRAEAEILSRRLDELNRQIDILPTVEERLTNIDEQEKSLSNALFTLRQKQLEAQMKEAETLSNVFIVDAPHLPRKEKFPNRIAVVLLGILAGIASAGAFIGIARAVREASGSSYLLTVFTGPAENNTTAHVLDNAHSDFQGQSHSLSSPVSPALIESKVRNWISTNNDMDQYLDDLFDGKQNPNASAHNAVREQVYLSLRHQTQSSANQSSSHDEKQSLEEYSPSHSFS